MFSLFRFNDGGFHKMWSNIEKAQEEMYSSFFSNISESSFPKKDDPNFSYTEESVDGKDHITTRETWTSLDGSVNFSRVISTPKKKEETHETISAQIKEAVLAEDYEKAAKLKKQLTKIKKKED
jgi:hypothetical protein